MTTLVTHHQDTMEWHSGGPHFVLSLLILAVPLDFSEGGERCGKTSLPVFNYGGRSIKSGFSYVSDLPYFSTSLTLPTKAYTGIRQPWCYQTDLEPYVADSVAVHAIAYIADAKRWQIPSYAHMFSLILLRDQWYDKDQVIDDQWRIYHTLSQRMHVT